MTNKTTTNIIMYLHFKIIKSILFKKVILPNPIALFRYRHLTKPNYITNFIIYL